MNAKQVYGYGIPLAITCLGTLASYAQSNPQDVAYAGALAVAIHLLSDVRDAGPPPSDGSSSSTNSSGDRSGQTAGTDWH